MPDSPRIASSITMGVSWGVGGGVVSIILFICKYGGRFEPAFAAFAAATLASSVLCVWLPEVSGFASGRLSSPEERDLRSPVSAEPETLAEHTLPG